MESLSFYCFSRCIALGNPGALFCCGDILITHILLLGFEVNKLSEISIKTSNVMEFIESDIKTLKHQEHMILLSNMYEKIYLQGFLEVVLEATLVSSL